MYRLSYRRFNCNANENIQQKIESGSSKFNAAINGSKEVIFAIISTSVVLISIFMPIIFSRK